MTGRLPRACSYNVPPLMPGDARRAVLQHDSRDDRQYAARQAPPDHGRRALPRLGQTRDDEPGWEREGPDRRGEDRPPQVARSPRRRHADRGAAGPPGVVLQGRGADPPRDAELDPAEPVRQPSEPASALRDDGP